MGHTFTKLYWRGLPLQFRLGQVMHWRGLPLHTWYSFRRRAWRPTEGVCSWSLLRTRRHRPWLAVSGISSPHVAVHRRRVDTVDAIRELAMTACLAPLPRLLIPWLPALLTKYRHEVSASVVCLGSAVLGLYSIPSFGRRNGYAMAPLPGCLVCNTVSGRVVPSLYSTYPPSGDGTDMLWHPYPGFSLATRSLGWFGPGLYSTYPPSGDGTDMLWSPNPGFHLGNWSLGKVLPGLYSTYPPSGDGTDMLWQPYPGLLKPRFTNCRRRSPPSRGPLCSAALILKAAQPGRVGGPGWIPS